MIACYFEKRVLSRRVCTDLPQMLAHNASNEPSATTHKPSTLLSSLPPALVTLIGSDWKGGLYGAGVVLFLVPSQQYRWKHR